MQFRATKQSYIGHSLVQADQVVSYDPGKNGHISDNLWPVDDEAQAYVDAQKQPHPAKGQGADKVEDEAKPKRARSAKAADPKPVEDGETPKGEGEGDEFA